jgi:hypothetical protein
VRASIKVDGERFFKGKVSCVLTANVGRYSAESRLSRRRNRMTGAWS